MDRRRQQQQYGVELSAAPWVSHPAGATTKALDCPDPPGLLSDIKTTIGRAVFPGSHHGKEASSSRKHFVVSLLRGLFPVLSWGRNYEASMFKADFMAGLTLASLCIPQSIGYASLAKLDPQYGLYTSVVPPLIYAVMGSSREIAIGPVAVVSMLLSSSLQDVINPITDPIAYTKLIFTVTFFTGAFQCLFGILRLGFLVDFLSHASIVGFMGGAAIIIGLQQLKGLFGLTHFTNKTDVVSVSKAVTENLFHEWYPLNLVLGCSFLIFILITRFIGKRNTKLFWLPALSPLISVILSTLIVYLTRADRHGVKIVKHFKGGLNPSSLDQLQLNGSNVGTAAKVGLISAIIALTEAIAVGRSFASTNGYRLDGNKEMVAMGFMNLVGSLTSCYVATGSFSRTAVNYSAGCKTAVSNIVMAVTVLIALELMTKLLYYTPISILASVIISALPGLIDVHEAYNIWRIDKLDFLSCLAAFFGVLFVSVEIGLLLAIAISFGKIILNAIRPSTEPLGRINDGTDLFVGVHQFPNAVRPAPGILIIRINSALLCFANANFINERIMSWVEEEMRSLIKEAAADHQKNQMNRVVILDLSNVINIDTSGIIALEELHKNLSSLHIELAMSNLRWQVIHKLKLAKCVDRIGREKFFLTVNEAMNAYFTTGLVAPCQLVERISCL